MFNLSIYDMAFLGIAAYFTFGRSQFVYGATHTGRLMGRSVARLTHWRSRFTTAIASESLANLHPELRKGFSGLMRVQSELMSATINPISSVQRMLFVIICDSHLTFGIRTCYESSDCTCWEC